MATNEELGFLAYSLKGDIKELKKFIPKHSDVPGISRLITMYKHYRLKYKCILLILQDRGVL